MEIRLKIKTKITMEIEMKLKMKSKVQVRIGIKILNKMIKIMNAIIIMYLYRFYYLDIAVRDCEWDQQERKYYYSGSIVRSVLDSYTHQIFVWDCSRRRRRKEEEEKWEDERREETKCREEVRWEGKRGDEETKGIGRRIKGRKIRRI